MLPATKLGYHLTEIAPHVLAADPMPHADDGAFEHRVDAFGGVDGCTQSSALVVT